MRVTIDTDCGDIPDQLVEWLKMQKVGGRLSLKTGTGEFYLKSTGPDEFLFTPVLPPEPPKPHWGNALWKEFHETAWSGEMTLSYLHDFMSRLPKMCACQNHAEKILRENPFNQVAPKEWSVKYHNLINKQLNKPEFSYSQAEELYAK